MLWWHMTSGDELPHDELFPKANEVGRVMVEEEDERVKQIKARTPDLEIQAWLVNDEGDVLCSLEFAPTVTLYRHYMNLIGAALERLVRRQQVVAMEFLHKQSAQELEDIKRKKALAATPEAPKKSTDLN